MRAHTHTTEYACVQVGLNCEYAKRKRKRKRRMSVLVLQCEIESPLHKV